MRKLSMWLIGFVLFFLTALGLVIFAFVRFRDGAVAQGFWLLLLSLVALRFLRHLWRERKGRKGALAGDR